jgi:hypothetical protein
MKLLITILVTFLLSMSTYTAKVVRVSDGDTITVLTDNKEQIRIRLEDTFYEVFGTIEIYSRELTTRWRSLEKGRNRINENKIFETRKQL